MYAIRSYYVLALMLATRLGLTQDKVRNIGIGAIIHDFGKTLIPQEILNKKGRLSEDEFKQIKLHPANLYNAIKDNPAFSPTSKMVGLMHHEKLDGSGYPLGRITSYNVCYTKLLRLAY